MGGKQELLISQLHYRLFSGCAASQNQARTAEALTPWMYAVVQNTGGPERGRASALRQAKLANGG
jgi:hypothetical protein